MAFAGISGVLKAHGTLWPLQLSATTTTGQPDPTRPIQSALSVFPVIATLGLLDWRAAHDSANPLGTHLGLFATSNDGEVLLKRVSCTSGTGVCRRYRLSFDRVVWQTHLANGGYGPSIPGELSPRTYIVEDTCPWTRPGILEGYSNRFELLEWYHRMTNP